MTWLPQGDDELARAIDREGQKGRKDCHGLMGSGSVAEILPAVIVT